MSAPSSPYDVFLSHDHEDSAAVEELGRVLTAEWGFRVWLDRWVLVPGQSWQQELAKGLQETTTCAVCLGGRTADGWFRQEIERALALQATCPGYRVIPVLLPDATTGDASQLLPAFVGLRTWVDFRPGRHDPQALHLLRHGILGTAPGPWPPLPERLPALDGMLDEVRRDLLALDQIRALLHEEVLMDTQRRILSRRFP